MAFKDFVSKIAIEKAELKELKKKLKKAENAKNLKAKKEGYIKRLKAGTTKTLETLEQELAAIEKEKASIADILLKKHDTFEELAALDNQIASLKAEKPKRGKIDKRVRYSGFNAKMNIFANMACNRGFVCDSTNKTLSKEAFKIALDKENWSFFVDNKKKFSRKFGPGSSEKLDQLLARYMK